MESNETGIPKAEEPGTYFDVIYKFRNEIAAQKKYSLVDIHTGRPLQVVDHIGCHYAKMFPSKGIGGAEFPAVLSGMVSAWGGQPVDYPERRHCCGFGFRNYLVLANRGFSVANSKKKFESMQPYEPDFIITNCPGCAMFLDKWQYTISEMEGTTYGPDGYGIPVLTYEEVAALVLGYDPGRSACKCIRSASSLYWIKWVSDMIRRLIIKISGVRIWDIPSVPLISKSDLPHSIVNNRI